MQSSSILSVQALVRAAFWLGLVASVGACKTESRDGSLSSTPVAQGQPQGGTGGQADGTGDSTGGNGINGKPFESYIVEDIATLPEWKEWIEPIREHLDGLTNESAGKNSYFRISRMKKWYFVPVRLNQIPKSRIGVDFVQDPVQQLALQTRNEIWIDSELYEKASSRDRALLLMHEMVVQMYLFRFETLQDLCLKMPEENCGDAFEKMDERTKRRYRPEERRALQREDYEAIRAVTSEVFNNYKSFKSFEDQNRLFRSHHFDSRFFKKDQSSQPEIKIAKVTEAEFSAWVRGQIQLGNAPKFLSRDADRVKSESARIGLDAAGANLIVQVGDEETAFPFASSRGSQAVSFSSQRVSDQGDETSSFPSHCSSLEYSGYRALEQGQTFANVCVLVGLQPYREIVEGAEQKLENLRIEAILIYYMQVLSAEVAEGNKKIVAGYLDPQVKAGWILSRERLSEGAQAQSDYVGGFTWELTIPVQK